MNFERHKDAHKALKIGMKANAIEIGNLYSISLEWDMEDSRWNRNYVNFQKTLNIIDAREVPEYLRKIHTGYLFHRNFAFEEPIINGVAPKKTWLLEDCKGKFVKYGGEYYEL